MSVSLTTVGNWYNEIEVPLSNALSAATETLGWSGYKACEKAIVYMAKSAGTLTKQSPKLRPIVANPLFSLKGGKGAAYKKDMRRARYGVWKYDKNGNKVFDPIFRGGEFGAAVKYISKDKVAVKIGNKSSKVKRAGNKVMKLFGSKVRFGTVGRWQIFPAGTDEGQVKGIKEHWKRKIRRSGLARKSWMWGIKGFHPDAIPNVTEIEPILSAVQCGLVLTNKIRYLSRITPSNLVEEVSRRATNSIMFQVAKEIEKKMAVEVPLRASSRRQSVVTKLESEFALARSRGTI